MAYGRKPWNNNYNKTNDGKPKKKWIPFKKQTPVVRNSAYKPMLNPSLEQLAVIDDMVNNPDPLVVRARAGCAKTSTAVEGMRQIPLSKSICYTVFANKNAREAEAKTEARVMVATCHALGLKAMRRSFGQIEVSGKGEKDQAIAGALVGNEDKDEDLRYSLVRAMDLSKSYLADTVEKVGEACDRHDVDMGDMGREEFCSLVLKGMSAAEQQCKIVSFSDMLYLPIKLNLNVEQYDVMVVDEQQDLSPARSELCVRSLRRGGKWISVGDEAQSIFLWTGTSDQPMQNMIDRLHAHVLPLNTTFRCAKKIVELAREYVPEYNAADTNSEGEVLNKTYENMADEATVGDFILCRLNKPLVEICLDLVKRGTKASVLGKDLGKNMAWMLKRSQTSSVSAFLDWLDNWKEEECARLIERNRPYEHIVDKYECLNVLCEGEKTLEDVKKRIILMFGDENKIDDWMKERVVLSTIHKAKGMESDRVWLIKEKLDDERDPNNWKVKYVGITRARNSLYWV